MFKQLILQESYKPRSIRCLGVKHWSEMSLKLYGIRYGGESVDPRLLESARRIGERAATMLESTHGIGFLIVHQGRSTNFFSVCVWANENELRQLLWTSPSDDPLSLEPAGPNTPIACPWDLRVMYFESEAWVHHVLDRPDGPDIVGYMTAQLHEVA